MLTKLKPFAYILFGLFITVSSCKKEASIVEQDINTDQSAVHTEDQANVHNQMDDITNEMNQAVEGSPAFSGRFTQTAVICGATVVADTLSNPRTITITYNGNNCANTHFRWGTVVLSMPAGVRWKNPGAVLTISYNNLRIRSLADSTKRVRINGVKTITNVSGGLIHHLQNTTTINEIVHKIQSENMSIGFSDTTQRVWKIAKRRIYNINNGLVIRTTGFHVFNNISGIAEWGIDRFGHPFYTAIVEPMTLRQNCNFRLTSGQVIHHRLAVQAVVIFGLNSAGDPTPCPGAAPYYYKVTWTGPGGNTHTVIRPY
jgi:hypothetical protein